MLKLLKKYKVEIILGALIVLYIICFSFLSIQRYITLNSHYYDLGIMNQVVYNTSRGRILEMTDQTLKRNINRMAVHFDPIMVVFAPFYLIYPGAETLLAGQTVFVALGALAVYLIAREILKKKGLSLFFAVVYLGFFPVERANLFDFHAVVMATTFFLFAWYFYLVKKKFWFFFFIILSLMTKEHVGLVVTLFGIYLFFFKKDRKTGLATFLMGIFFFIATVYFIIPYFRQSTHFAMRYFSDFGDSPTSVLVNLIRHPLVTIRHIFNTDTYDYLLRMLAPLFYALFSPWTLLIALPEFAINIISINDNMRSIYFHYNAIIVPFLIYSAIVGYQAFNNKVKNKKIKNFVFMVFIIVNLFSIYLYNPIPLKFFRNQFILKSPSQLTIKTISIWENNLRDDSIKVATTPKLAPFFTERLYYYNFLYDPAFASMGYSDEDVIASSKDTYKLAEYVIIDKTEIGDINGPGTLPVKFYQNLRSDNNYRMIYSNDRDIEVYKRVKSS